LRPPVTFLALLPAAGNQDQNLPRSAALVAATRPGGPDPGDRHIRQNQTRPIWF